MKHLTAKDITEIIRVAKESGVDTLELNGLKITYKGSDEVQSKWPIHTHPISEVSGDKDKEIKDKGLIDLERQLNLELLSITDPEAYEKALFSGEINE